ncbi:MAG TPA: thioredoxin family protein [Edaphocola sp.]|nr:thioredoxin family protein [Edaphocola sp.]
MRNISTAAPEPKKFFFMALFAVCLSFFSWGQQETGSKPFYNPKADARADIKNATAQAEKEHKNVMLQIGGNWCIWCTRFHNLIETNDSLNKLMSENYVYLPVNYDQNNKNSPLWAELGFPQRFGFPVFVILDKEGKIIHIQNSAYLEEGKGHSPGKVAQFLKNWSPAAVAGKTISR